MRRGPWAWIAALTVASCDSAHGGSAPILSIEYDPADFDHVTLSWTAAPGLAREYLVEARQVPHAFEALNGSRLGPETIGVIIEFDPATPELLDFEFRVRAEPGGTSNVVGMHRGLRPPGTFWVWASDQPSAMQLQWVNQSAAADAFVLERRSVRLDGTESPWAGIPLPFPADRYTDSDLVSWRDGARLDYRLAAAHGNERSLWASVGTAPSPLGAPLFTEASPIAGGVRLSFANTSAYATELIVERAAQSGFPSAEIARLPVSATQYDDLTATPGRYRYRLTAHRPTGFPFASDVVERQAFCAPPASWGLDASLVRIPVGSVAARAPSGAFATAGKLGGYPFDAPFYFAPDTAATTLRPVTGARAFGPGIVVDADGHAHVVYADGPADWTNPISIVHAWHDGASWQTEEIARRVLSPGDATQVLRFDLGPDGTLHASWQAGPDPSRGLEVARRVGGSWQLENVSLALGAPYLVRWVDHFLAGDDAGEPHLAVVQWDHTLLHFHRVAGAWTAEVVPTGVVDGTSGDDVGVRLLAGGGKVTVVHAPTNPGSTIAVVEWTADGWGSPTTVATIATAGRFEAERSSDGARVAVAASGWDGATCDGRLWIREAGAVTEKRRFCGASGSAVGFRPDGKAWVLDGLSDYGPETLDAMLFEEP